MPRRRKAQSRRGSNAAGLGTLIIGLILASAGVYLFTNQVEVGAGPFGGVAWFGTTSVGLLLIPLLLGIGLLFFDFGSRIGKLLVGIGAVILLASVLNTFRISYQSTSLFNTLLMLGLSISGVGLMARALLSVSASSSDERDADGDDDDDDETVRLRVELSAAQERIRALEAPRDPDAARSMKPASVDAELADLKRRKHTLEPDV